MAKLWAFYERVGDWSEHHAHGWGCWAHWWRLLSYWMKVVWVEVWAWAVVMLLLLHECA